MARLSTIPRHNENEVTMTTVGLWRYGDWRRVATGGTALAINNGPSRQLVFTCVQMTRSRAVFTGREHG